MTLNIIKRFDLIKVKFRYFKYKNQRASNVRQRKKKYLLTMSFNCFCKLLSGDSGNHLK